MFCSVCQQSPCKIRMGNWDGEYHTRTDSSNNIWFCASCIRLSVFLKQRGGIILNVFPPGKRKKGEIQHWSFFWWLFVIWKNRLWAHQTKCFCCIKTFWGTEVTAWQCTTRTSVRQMIRLAGLNNSHYTFTRCARLLWFERFRGNVKKRTTITCNNREFE